MERISEFCSNMGYQLGETNKLIVGIETGFHELDDITGGFRKSELTIITAETKMGKTPLLLSILKNMVYNNSKSVVYFSLYESKFQILSYLFSNICDIKLEDLLVRKLNDDKIVILNNAINKIEDSSLYIDDSSDLSLTLINEKLDILINEDEIQFDAIFVDGLKLMTHDGNLFSTNKKTMDLILLGLKAIAKMYEVPIIVTYELDAIRGVSMNDKRPQLSDLDEKTNLFRKTDMIWFIYRAEYYHITEDENGESTIGTAEIIVAKNNGTVQLRFNPYCSKFSSD